MLLNGWAASASLSRCSETPSVLAEGGGGHGFNVLEGHGLGRGGGGGLACGRGSAGGDGRELHSRPDEHRERDEHAEGKPVFGAVAVSLEPIRWAGCRVRDDNCGRAVHGC